MSLSIEMQRLPSQPPGPETGHVSRHGRGLDLVSIAFGYEGQDDFETVGYGYHSAASAGDDESFAYGSQAKFSTTPHEVIVTERVWFALVELRTCTESHPGKLSGVPVLRGTRFTLAQLIAELADGRTTVEISDAFTIEIHLIEQFLTGLSAYLNRPVPQ